MNYVLSRRFPPPPFDQYLGACVTGEKNTNCFKYFTCTAVHRKEMKLKEVVRLRSLYTT